MNKKISIIGATVLAISTGVFFICQLISAFAEVELLTYISYLVCIFLSWGYIICTIGNGYLCSDRRKIAAEAAKLFAVIYSVFVSIVYFSQLSVVHYRVLSEDIVNALDMVYPGSWLFVIDITGYGIMALSTLFLGLSIEPVNKSEKLLKLFSLIHGVFIVSLFMPLTDMFLSSNADATINSGSLALAIWCLIFIPIPIFSIKRFIKTDM